MPAPNPIAHLALAVESSMGVIRRLSLLLLWLIVATAHLAAVVVLLLVLWWLELRPGDLGGAARQALQSGPISLLVAAGATAIGVIGLYWRLVRWATTRLFRDWLAVYVTRDI